MILFSLLAEESKNADKQESVIKFTEQQLREEIAQTLYTSSYDNLDQNQISLIELIMSHPWLLDYILGHKRELDFSKVKPIKKNGETIQSITLTTEKGSIEITKITALNKSGKLTVIYTVKYNSETLTFSQEKWNLIMKKSEKLKSTIESNFSTTITIKDNQGNEVEAKVMIQEVTKPDPTTGKMSKVSQLVCVANCSEEVRLKVIAF